MRVGAKSRLVGAGILAVVVAMGGGSPTLAVDEPENIITYRKGIMRANGGHMGSLAAMARGEISFVDEAALHARTLHEMSQHMARLFPEGTGPGDTEVDTRALSTIWERPDEFQQAIERLQEQSAIMIEVAESGDQVAFAQQVGQLGRLGCGGCHETFRREEE